jgi:hypothetical protein
VRKSISKVLLKPKIRSTIDTVLRYLGVGLIALIIESVNELFRLQKKFKEVQQASAGSGDDAPVGKALDMSNFPFKRAIGQRNLYMASFCLIVALTLGRLVDLVSNEMEYRRTIQEANGGKPIDEQGRTLVTDAKVK